MTVDEIIKKAGDGNSFASGAKAIADKIASRDEGDIKPETIYKWTKIGVPDRYWSAIIELTQVSPGALYEANVSARSTV